MLAFKHSPSWAAVTKNYKLGELGQWKCIHSLTVLDLYVQYQSVGRTILLEHGKDVPQASLLISRGLLACGSKTPLYAWHSPACVPVPQFLLFIRAPVLLD
jgi:hypothetical protein